MLGNKIMYDDNRYTIHIPKEDFIKIHDYLDSLDVGKIAYSVHILYALSKIIFVSYEAILEAYENVSIETFNAVVQAYFRNVTHIELRIELPSNYYDIKDNLEKMVEIVK